MRATTEQVDRVRAALDTEAVRAADGQLPPSGPCEGSRQAVPGGFGRYPYRHNPSCGSTKSVGGDSTYEERTGINDLYRVCN